MIIYNHPTKDQERLKSCSFEYFADVALGKYKIMMNNEHSFLLWRSNWLFQSQEIILGAREEDQREYYYL